MYVASSCDARGITPGSVNVVRNRAPIVNTNRQPPMIGMASVMRTAKYGQLYISEIDRQMRIPTKLKTNVGTYSKAKNSVLVNVMRKTVK